MKKTFIAIMAVTALALFASGCRHSKDPAARAEAITSHLAKKLDLSEAQKAKTLPLVQAVLDERQSWRGQMPQALGELKGAFGAESFDAKALNSAMAQRETKLAQSRALLVQKLGEFHAILTPEQRAKVDALLQKFEGRMNKYHGRKA
jgi:Spy/CpxP family protein refolding chaperone